MWIDLGVALAALLFGGMGFYLSLIARFYRLKFGNGPSVMGMIAALLATMAGMLMRLEALAFLPAWLPAAFMCAGGAAFSYLAFVLYRSMMHAKPRVEI